VPGDLVNGAVLDLAIPIHDGGYDLDGVYHPAHDATARFAAAAEARGVPMRILRPGESVELRTT